MRRPSRPAGCTVHEQPRRILRPAHHGSRPGAPRPAWPRRPVEFRAPRCGALPGQQGGRSMSIRVESFGLLTPVQDLGRRGFQHLGVGPTGAMDEVSHRLANLLLGNPADAPTLEMTLTGPSLLFETETLIALCGADLSPRIGDQPVPLWRPVLVGAGALLRFGKPLQGARCYLAVEGGFQVPKIMGSASTHLSAGFGGFQGRALGIGDRLETGPCPRDRYPTLRRHFHQEQRPFLGLDWFVPWARELDFAQPAMLRLIPGPQWPLLASASQPVSYT